VVVAQAEVNEARLNSFVGRMLGDMGATLSAALVIVGDRLGLYKALADGGPMTAATLAGRTGTAERNVREWLAGQAASDYVTYDADTGRFHLEPEQAMVFAQEGSPAFLAGFFEVAEAAFRATSRVEQAFRTGRGVGWHEHHRCLFCGTERFFRTSYRHHLVSEMAARARRCAGKAAARCDGGRCRLRPWGIHDPDGAGVPGVALLRLRLSPAVDRGGARGS
jgi:hypothetical protein